MRGEYSSPYDLRRSRMSCRKAASSGSRRRAIRSNAGTTFAPLGTEGLAHANRLHEMHVLHEDVIDRIKALPTDVPNRAEMRRAFAEQDERIARRLDPLEAALRQLIREGRRS